MKIQDMPKMGDLIKDFSIAPKKKDYIILINIKEMRNINDCFGHDIGDMVLQKNAEYLAALTDEKIYRIGGSDFAFFADSDDIPKLFQKVNMSSYKNIFNDEYEKIIFGLTKYTSYSLLNRTGMPFVEYIKHTKYFNAQKM